MFPTMPRNQLIVKSADRFPNQTMLCSYIQYELISGEYPALCDITGVVRSPSNHNLYIAAKIIQSIKPGGRCDRICFLSYCGIIIFLH